MNRILREWIVLPVIALGCLGGIAELQAVEEEDEEKAFEEADNAFVEGDFERGEKLLNEIAATIKKYLYLPPGGPGVIALWAVFTYCWDAFDV